eukprot:scaffold921_cov101-Isochrysis_galbana.AAC.14
MVAEDRRRTLGRGATQGVVPIGGGGIQAPYMQKGGGYTRRRTDRGGRTRRRTLGRVSAPGVAPVKIARRRARLGGALHPEIERQVVDVQVVERDRRCHGGGGVSSPVAIRVGRARPVPSIRVVLLMVEAYFRRQPHAQVVHALAHPQVARPPRVVGVASRNSIRQPAEQRARQRIPGATRRIGDLDFLPLEVDARCEVQAEVVLAFGGAGGVKGRAGGVKKGAPEGAGWRSERLEV